MGLTISNNQNVAQKQCAIHQQPMIKEVNKVPVYLLSTIYCTQSPSINIIMCYMCYNVYCSHCTIRHCFHSTNRYCLNATRIGFQFGLYSGTGAIQYFQQCKSLINLQKSFIRLIMSNRYIIYALLVNAYYEQLDTLHHFFRRCRSGLGQIRIILPDPDSSKRKCFPKRLKTIKT